MAEAQEKPHSHSDITIVNSTYKLGDRIGRGSFGVVYCGRNIQNNEEVAVKVASSQKSSHLINEHNVYQILQGGACVPQIRWYGEENGNNVLVMDLLGPTLKALFQRYNRCFSLKTVLMLADQMISCIEYVHKKNFIHLNIEPRNFVMGKGSERHKVFLIDFGRAKQYRKQDTHEHMPYRDGLKGTRGIARFVSVSAHQGVEQSRRDDMVSLGYLLLYVIMGRLPWQGIKSSADKPKVQKIYEMKMSIPVGRFCEDQPDEFDDYLDHCRGLCFWQEPNYEYLRQLFQKLLHKLGMSCDYKYDWIIEKS